ncbi:uncharacterized protein [Asterias amurensis]|uniref:uncharacterized protein n=1 Tax=Asterias amurensis TaxID=7602 RepID=UPI003AB22991
MSAHSRKMEHRLSLKDSVLQGDSMDSECGTPQDFLYETKFVVLNYLGLVPPDLDPGYSDYDMYYQSSASATPFVSDDERSSTSGGSRRSSDYLSVNTKVRARSSPKVSPRSATSSSHTSPAVFTSSANVFSRELSTSMSTSYTATSHQTITTTASFSATESTHSRAHVHSHEVRSTLEVSRDSWRSIDSDLCVDSVMEADDESSKSQPGSEDSEEISENPEIRIDDDSTGDSWELRRRQRHELVEPLREEVKQAMEKLHKELKEAAASSDENTPFRPSTLCPFSHEALVAERISQIGDKIMQQHGAELERTMREFFGSKADSNMTYAIFKSLVKQMMKSTVPGWYHLALMLKFTQRMALGLVNKSEQGFTSVTDFAVQYIEENLAQTIIDQGGWDAMTNINLDDINAEVLSELSSRNVSPMPLSSQDSHASQSMEPISPDAGTPVDSPNWKTNQQTGFPDTASDDGLNQLSRSPGSAMFGEPGELTHRSRSESRPEDLASLFSDLPPVETPMSHSMSSPSNLGGATAASQSGGMEVSHSAPVFNVQPDDDCTDWGQGSTMETDSQYLMSSGEGSTIVGDDGDSRGFESSSERNVGIKTVAAAVGAATATAAAAAGAIFAILKK